MCWNESYKWMARDKNNEKPMVFGWLVRQERHSPTRQRAELREEKKRKMVFLGNKEKREGQKAHISQKKDAARAQNPSKIF